MTFPRISEKFLEPISMWVMIAGIIALLQPWSFFLHRYGVTVILVGLAGFIVFSHFRPAEGREDG